MYENLCCMHLFHIVSGTANPDERYVTLRHLTEYMYVDSCTQSFIANEEESRGNVDAIHIGDWIACLGSKV